MIQKFDLLHRYREIHFCLGRSPSDVDQQLGDVEVFWHSLRALSPLNYTQDLQAKAKQWLEDELREPTEEKRNVSGDL